MELFDSYDYLAKTPTKKELLGENYKNQKTEDLNCNRKAFVLWNDDFTVATLQSYWTEVLRYYPLEDKIERLWDGYSKTTSGHISKFFRRFGINRCFFGREDFWKLPLRVKISL